MLDAFEDVNVPTSMDGSFADNVSTRRHLAYGGNDVTVVYRGDGTRGQPIRCDDGASVHSAAWDPEGARIAVASTNYLTVAQATGNILLHESRYPDTALSVAWAPSKNLICGSLGKVSVLADGMPIWEWETGTKDAARIACVAVSPCARLFACSLRNGRVKVWNEKGSPLGEFDGATGDPAYWHASRALAFSADFRFLAGELEHGAVWHEAGGWAMRKVLGEPKAIVPSSKAVAATGYRLLVPLHYIHACYVRSHFNAIAVGLQDAPRPKEILFALAMGDGGRVHARLGGLAKDDVQIGDGQR